MFVVRVPAAVFPCLCVYLSIVRVCIRVDDCLRHAYRINPNDVRNQHARRTRNDDWRNGPHMPCLIVPLESPFVRSSLSPNASRRCANVRAILVRNAMDGDYRVAIATDWKIGARAEWMRVSTDGPID